VTQHLFPAVIKAANFVGAAPAAQPYRSAEEYRAKFPDGRVGSDPTLATPERGAAIFAAAVDDVAEDYAAFVGDPSPPAAGAAGPSSPRGAPRSGKRAG
jgi:creatinine amidohydrolase